MNKFLVKYLNNCNEKELNNISFDSSYAGYAVEKYNYKNIKIFDLTVPQINILKQTALSTGADCAAHRDVVTGKAEKSDCILGGSISQLKKICEKLKVQPFNLKRLAEQIEYVICNKYSPIYIKNKIFDFSKPYVVGILNLTTNSFSDGGLYYDFDNAKSHLLEMIDDGADIIDIGAESTKPFSNPVSEKEQLEKLIPILEYIKSSNLSIPISIDTRSAVVAETCLDNGADIINDVSGLEYDKNMLSVISKYSVPVIVQHSKGTPLDMQVAPNYENIIEEIYRNLDNKINNALNYGVNKNNIIIDLGIGFGKTREQNFVLLDKVDEFYSLNSPMMIGISRKSLLNMAECSNEEKDIYTLALNSSLIDKKVNFLRVHNVKMTKKLISLKGYD